MINFKKSKDYLVCVDSDGCVMDTMNIKHLKCFGPEIVKTFNLYDYEDKILKYWNEMNLFSKDRGINRFKGLSLMFTYLSELGVDIEGREIFKKWCDETKSLSNESLIKEIVETNSDFLRKVLQWSNNVNDAINILPKYDCVFDGARSAMDKITQFADIVVVSSANRGALDEEWTSLDCKKYIKALLGQDIGTKSICIEKLLQLGYKKENTIMIGDSFGDLKAAKDNFVFFYPILVGKEKFSWDRFKDEILNKFINNEYNLLYQEKILGEMKEILK